jgi:DNA repair protein RadD
MTARERLPNRRASETFKLNAAGLRYTATMSAILRPYQAHIAAQFERLIAQGKRRVIVVAPTGSGKTVIACAIIAATPRRVLVVSHRREIVRQTSDKLTAAGVAHGVIQAGNEKKLRPMASVQVASIQTLHARAIRSSTMLMPLADLVIIDEAHHACAVTYRKILEAYPDAIVLGLTATPCRGDGRGLGGIFETMIECPQVAELIVGGYLVKARLYAPVNPDLKGVRTVKGDFHEGQLADRMDRDKLVGDIVTHWHKYGERRRTIAFACSVGHPIHIRDEFVKSGVRAEHLDGSTPKDERDAMLARLASGATEVIANCMVLTEGFDCPDIGCITLARPTKKMGLYRQMIGRGLRPADGKTDVVILDHSGAVFRHGLPEDRVEWSLDPDRHAEAPAHQARLKEKASRRPKNGALQHDRPRAAGPRATRSVARRRQRQACRVPAAVLAAGAVEPGGRHRQGCGRRSSLGDRHCPRARARARRGACPSNSRGSFCGRRLPANARGGRMKRTRKTKGPFVAVPKAIMAMPAWRAMTPEGRLLWIELRGWLRNDGLNNGKVHLSCRDAAEAIGLSKNTVVRRFVELEHFGFLRKTAEGFLGSDGRGIAAKYRFTDLAHGTHAATRDYEKWDGSPFVYTPHRRTRKKQKPVPPRGTPCTTAPDIRKAGNGGAVCTTAWDIGAAPRCTTAPYISRLPYPAVAVGQDQGSSTVRAPAQAGGAGSSPAPVASLTEYVLSVVNRVLDEHEARLTRRAVQTGA